MTQPHINVTSVSIVILNWNAAADTLACVQHISAWRTIQAHIIIVDNASEREDIQELEQQLFERHSLTLIRNPVNQGFSGGSNRGLERALQEVANAPVLLLNNDATIDEAALLTLVHTLKAHPHLGIVGPLLYTAGPNETLIAAGSKDPCWHIHTLDTSLSTSTPPFKIVHYLSGSVALMRAAALRQVGLFDENYFFNTEVADWCARARRRGWQTAIQLNARAHHNLHRSSAWRSTLYVYYVIRNRVYYVNKHGQTWKWPLLMFWSVYNFALAAKLRLAGQPAPAKAVWLGALDALQHRLGGQNARVLAALPHRPSP